MRRLPLSGTLFLLGFLAITGSPPFGPFVSEFTILNGAFTTGRFVVGRVIPVTPADYFHRNGPHGSDRRAGKALGRFAPNDLSRRDIYRFADSRIVCRGSAPWRLDSSTPRQPVA